MSRTLVFSVALGLASVAGLARAREEKPAAVPDRPVDEAAVREASQAFARAFEAGDPKAVAASWTEEGEYADEGLEPVRGRAAVERAYAAFFAKRPGLKVESNTQSVRFLGADTALEEGTFTVRTKDSPSASSRFSSLYVRQGGRWLIALLKEWPDAGASRPSLDDLAWLVGTWESDGPDLKARVTYEWSETKAFLRSKFSFTPKAGGATPPPTSGHQILAVDRAEGALRAWTFEPDGGFGEATWTHEGDRWEIESAGTLADGTRTTALNFLTPSGKDAFTWRSVRRTLDGKDAPDVGPVKAVRVAEGK